MILPLFFCILANFQLVFVQASPRIIGGWEASAGYYPFAAAINVQTSNGNFFCGGVIYNQNWIITSGQCANDAVLFSIQIGSNALNGTDSNRVTVVTSDSFLHPDFNSATLENDLALVKLRMPLKYTQYVQPVYLPFKDLDPGTLVVSIGWGQTSDSDPGLSDKLRFVKTIILSNVECKLYYGNQIGDKMICAEGNYNEGTCIGDTGSPLLEFYMYRMHYLVGISSFISGKGCESTDPSGYTRIFPYVDWIKNVTTQ